MRKILLLRRAGPTGAGRTESRASPVGPATCVPEPEAAAPPAGPPPGNPGGPPPPENGDAPSCEVWSGNNSVSRSTISDGLELRSGKTLKVLGSSADESIALMI